MMCWRKYKPAKGCTGSIYIYDRSETEGRKKEIDIYR